jgi:hypothetical protein
VSFFDRDTNKVLLAIAAIAGFVMLLITQIPPAVAEDGARADITQGAAISYRSDKQTSFFRTAIAVVDTAATTLSDVNLSTCGEFDLGEPGKPGAARQTINVTPHFSAAAATVSVTVYTGWKNSDGTYADQIKKQGPVTFTAPASGSQRATRYVGTTQFFDSTGSNVAWIVVSTAPSSGTVSFAVGSQ